MSRARFRLDYWLVIDHNTETPKYDLSAGSTYIKLLTQLDHQRKVLVIIQNIGGNECFKWCLFRYLHPADRNPSRITKADKDFAKRFDFNKIKFLVKIRETHKIGKNQH